jgi:hypothetical protein
MTPDRIWWKEDKAAPYRRFTSEDAARLNEEFECNGRAAVLSAFAGVSSRRPSATDLDGMSAN